MKEFLFRDNLQIDMMGGWLFMFTMEGFSDYITSRPQLRLWNHFSNFSLASRSIELHC